ncbi:MAG: hypothetical protein LLG04_03635 [Parachlamydia sp.]|nr:hypothetical protein [Parachlamydia sp.]
MSIDEANCSNLLTPVLSTLPPVATSVHVFACLQLQHLPAFKGIKITLLEAAKAVETSSTREDAKAESIVAEYLATEPNAQESPEQFLAEYPECKGVSDCFIPNDVRFEPDFLRLTSTIETIAEGELKLHICLTSPIKSTIRLHMHQKGKMGWGQAQHRDGTHLAFWIQGGKRQGDALETRPNGSRLKFSFQEDVPEGSASEQLPGGMSLSFLFRRGVRQGSAVLETPGVKKLRFSYSDGAASGDATEEYRSGKTIQFRFQRGKREGGAKLVSKDGTELLFTYQGGKRHGKALQKAPDGSSCIYNYEAGVVLGKAVATMSDGRKITYSLVMGKRSGEAVEIIPGGFTLVFNYHKESREGPATLKFEKGGALTFGYQNGIPSREATVLGDPLKTIQCTDEEKNPLQFYKDYLSRSIFVPD